MGKYIGPKTTSLVELEKARYNRLLEILKTNNPFSGIEGDLRNLITLDRNDYHTCFDLDKSKFSLYGYQIDDEVSAYDYEINFVSSSQDNYYRGIILTYLKFQYLWNKVCKIDEKSRRESMVFYPEFGKTIFSENIINRTFSNNYDGMPYIVYGSTNIGLESHWKDNPEIRPFVKYHEKSGKYICHMILDSPEECAVITRDRVLGSQDIERWCINNFRDGDDPTKIIEIAGPYNLSKFNRLVKNIR